MDTTTAQLHVFLDICHEVESISARIYSFFARNVTQSALIARMWYKTAREEEEHARNILLAKEMMSSVSWISIQSWNNALEAIQEIRQIEHLVQQATPTLEKSLRFALDCERHMECMHMHNAILVRNKTGNNMFRALMQSDRDHVDMLESALFHEHRNSYGKDGIIELELSTRNFLAG